MRETLSTHTQQDDVNFQAINVALDTNFKELMLLVHGLELNILREKADHADVKALEKKIEGLSALFWKLLIILAGSGVVGAGAVKMFFGV